MRYDWPALGLMSHLVTNERTQICINAKEINLKFIVDNTMFRFCRKRRNRDESPPAAWTRDQDFDHQLSELSTPAQPSDPYTMPTLSTYPNYGTTESDSYLLDSCGSTANIYQPDRYKMIEYDPLTQPSP